MRGSQSGQEPRPRSLTFQAPATASTAAPGTYLVASQGKATTAAASAAAVGQPGLPVRATTATVTIRAAAISG